jgi:hypothetical protein
VQHEHGFALAFVGNREVQPTEFEFDDRHQSTFMRERTGTR